MHVCACVSIFVHIQIRIGQDSEREKVTGKNRERRKSQVKHEAEDNKEK